jgi:hypothetical protein
MKPILLAAAAALLLTACQTTTVYAPATDRYASGFNEQRIEDGRYRVTYRGGNGAPLAQVEDYALLRAADITVRDGYDWFRVVDSRGGAIAGRGPYVGIGGGGASFGRHSAVGVGVSVGAIDLSGGPQLSQTLEIVMGRGAKPSDADAYDARDVQRHIGPRAGRGPA